MAKKKNTLTLEERLEQALVPKAEQPYPVPENWCWVKLEAISTIIMGQSPSSEDTTDNSDFIPLVGGAADMGIFFPEVRRYTKIPTKVSEKGDIIFCIRATLGRPVFSNGQYCLGRGVAAIRSNVCSPKFLRYFFLCFEQYLYDNATGTTFAQVNSSVLQNMPFVFSTYSEQQRIVDRIESLFSKLDEAKEKAQAALDSFEIRKVAILHKAFTGELTAKWREENYIGINSWKTLELNQVCTVNPKKTDTKNLPDNLEVSFFPMTSLSEIYGEITMPQVRKLKEVRSGYTNFLEGDVVFAKITPCMENGKSAIIGKLVNGIGYGTTEFYVLRCGKELFNRYLYHIVRNRTFRDEAQAVMSGAVGQQRVPKEFMETYRINLPSKPEQIEIVRILDSFFAKERKAKELCSVLDKIDLIKKSILARAFRGELGTNDPTEESAMELLKSII